MAAQRQSWGGGPTAPPTTQAPRQSWTGGPTTQPATPAARQGWAGVGTAPAAPSPGGKSVTDLVTGSGKKIAGPLASAFAGTPPSTTGGSPGGSQTGPTYIEDRYLSRANGTDPGWEYATGRATDQINNQYAARGGYNSSGAMQSIDDMFANATSQREGQLDALAGGATTAHQNALNSMFSTGLGIDNGVTSAGQQGTAGAGDAMSQNLRSQLELILSKAGVDSKKMQGEINAIIASGQTGASVLGSVTKAAAV